MTYTATDSDPPVGSGDSVVTMFAVSIALDLIPSFERSVPQQTYIQGVMIADLVSPTVELNLPGATGGNGALTYEYIGGVAGWDRF